MGDTALQSPFEGPGVPRTDQPGMEALPESHSTEGKHKSLTSHSMQQDTPGNALKPLIFIQPQLAVLRCHLCRG